MGIVLSDSKRILCNKRIICINTVITSDPTAQESSFMKTYAQKLYLDVKSLYVSISHFFITQMFFVIVFHCQQKP